MPTYYYYTNSFDGTYLDWIEFGTSPYLSAIDYPTNYISAPLGTHKCEGIWNFPNSGAENAETLNSVEIEIYSTESEDPDLGYPTLSIYVYDGSSWTLFTKSMDTGAWSWKAKDISSVINTWAKLDACKIYYRISLVGDQTLLIDCMRLKATTTAVVVPKAGLHPSKIVPILLDD